MRARSFFVRFACCALWLLLVGAGFAAILNYQAASGAAGVTPQQWPAQTRIALAADRQTLIMFVHPKCPCSRASLEELNRLLAQCPGKAAVQVWFFKPAGASDDWTRTGLWWSVAAIPGVVVKEDPDGAQARLFGAETSGYVLLYDTRGQLRFKGGITGGRGHAGDNEGEAALAASLSGQTAALTETRVYGCSLSGQCATASESNIQ